MGKRYLDTKKDSLESSILNVWQTAVEEKETRVDGRTKQYKEHRAKLEAARKARAEKLTAKQKQLDVDGDGEIEGSDLAKLRKKAAKKDKKEEVKEYYEMGTDEYRKHTQEVTPGQEIQDYGKLKMQSMKEALAKVWGLDEAKKENKDLTKMVKDGKTLTGKVADKIDLEPKVEKKK